MHFYSIKALSEISVKFHDDIMPPKKVSTQGLVLDRSVYMAAICRSCPISAVSTNKQLLSEKSTCVQFQVDISLSSLLYKRTWLNRLSLSWWSFIYVHMYPRGSAAFSFGCYKHRGKLNMPYPYSGSKNQWNVLLKL